MTKLALCLAAASSLAIGGAAFAQSSSATTPKTPATPPPATAPATPMTPPTSTATTPAGAAMSAPAAQPGAPVNPAAQPAAPAQTAQAPAAPVATVATGMTLKDNTGATVGQITDLKADASGGQMATVKMGEDSFTVAASSLVVQNGAAVINLTQAQLQAMVHKPQG